MLEVVPECETPRVWRVSPSYNAYQGDYRDEAAAALGFDGMSVWWSASWGQLDGHGEVYSVPLPVDWHTHLLR